MSALSNALAAMDKATPGPMYRQSTGNGEGIRTKAGFICFMYKPTHYSGQDERYKQELEQMDADAMAFEASHDALAIIKRMLPYIENTRDEVKSVVEMGFFHSKALDAQLVDLNDIIGQIKGDDALIARAKPEEVGG